MKTASRLPLLGAGLLALPCALSHLTAASGDHLDIYELSLEKLASVVVTDTKIAQRHDTVTQKLETLQAEDLETFTTPLRNLSEYLRYTAGQFVNPLSRNDANWGSYAGLGPKYNTYALDGLPIDSFADAMSLDSWALESVEVYKGPAAVLYSNYLTMDFAGNEMSLAGLTNFLLKDRIDGPASRIATSYGSYNTSSARVYHQDRIKHLSYFVGGSYEHSDYTDYGTDGSWLNILRDPHYEKTKLYARLAYAPGDGSQKLSLFAHFTEHTGDVGRPNRDFHNDYALVNAAYSKTFGDDWTVQLKAGYRNYDRQWGEDNYPAALSLREHDGVRQEIYLSDLTVNYRHAGDSMLTAGADLQKNSYETYPLANEVRARAYGLFLQEKLVLDRWVFRVGGRANRTHHAYDKIDAQTPELQNRDWSSTLWSAGARYNVTPHLSFYGNVGSSFVAPSAKSVCGTIAASDSGVPGKNGQLPNPNLSPEKGTGADLGIEFHTDSTLTLGLRGFLNRIDDAIIDNAVSSVPSQSISVNAGKARSYGVAATASQTLTRHLSWFANVTFTSSQVDNTLVPDQDGTEIPFVPDFVANAGLSIWLPLDIVASPRLQIVGNYFDSTSQAGRKRFGSYEVLDMKLQRTWEMPAGYSIRGSIDLNNLLDRRYEMPWQFQNPGFNASIGIEVSF
jgi:outer membrane receptor protein involved in Fe transport